MSLDLASSRPSVHFENREDGLGQQAQIVLSQHDKKMIEPEIVLGQHDKKMTGPQIDLGPHDKKMSGPEIDVGQHDKKMSGPQIDLGQHDKEMTGPQIDLGQYDKEMSGLTAYEIITNPNINKRIKDKLIRLVLGGQLVLDGERFEKPSVRGIVPLLGKNAIQRLPSSVARVQCFCTLILDRLDCTLVPVDCQALILAPSSEATKEIEYVMRFVDEGVKVQAFADEEAAIYGGVVREKHVVVGTPGTVSDLLRRESLSPRNITMIVLDSADEMLSLGLKDQIYDIFQMLPSDLQLGVFTESTPPELNDFTCKLMNRPVV